MGSAFHPTNAAANTAAAAFAKANGHQLGRAQSRGGRECVHCAAVLTEDAALRFVEDSSVLELGSFSAPCPHRPPGSRPLA